MKRGRVAALALITALMLGGTAGFASGGQVLIETTSAAWSDRADVAATVTAGTWSSTTTSTCTAYGQNGAPLQNCSVTQIRYQGWGEPGQQIRNYYLSFAVPGDTRSVSFDVDLSTAEGDATSWSWQNAGLVAGGHVLPKAGWTCDQFPRLVGTGADWQTATMFFQVTESRAGGTGCPQ